MNDDGTPERHGYTESQIEWMFSQIEEAKKNGDYTFCYESPSVPAAESDLSFILEKGYACRL